MGRKREQPNAPSSGRRSFIIACALNKIQCSRTCILQLVIFTVAIHVLSLSQAFGDSQHSGTLSSVNLGLRYSSLLENRGVVEYSDFQIDPIVALFFFDDRLEYLGDSIGYRDFVISDILRLRTRLVSITDKPLFPAYDSVRSREIDRPDTYEWSNSAEFFFPGYNSNYQFEIDVTYAKDLSATHGSYFELTDKVKLARYRLSQVKTLIEPNLFFSLGWGEAATNRYYYGPSANSDGFNNFNYGIWFALPEEADRYYPIIQIKHFETLSSYRDSKYAKDRSDGWLFSFIASFGLLE